MDKARWHVSTLDFLTIVVAALVSFYATGLPRTLALLALALSLVLWSIRLPVFTRVLGWLAPGVPRVAASALVVALMVAGLALWRAPTGLERLPFASPRLDHLPADTRACLEKPEVEAYLRDLHRVVMHSWRPPQQAAGAQVVIEFTLLPSGEALNPLLVAGGDRGMGRSALQALTRAAPFASLGRDVDCLAGAPVRLSLSDSAE